VSNVLIYSTAGRDAERAAVVERMSRQGFNVTSWVAESQAELAEIGEAVRQAIQDADVVILLVGRSSRSEWSGAWDPSIEAAYHQATGARKQIFIFTSYDPEFLATGWRSVRIFSSPSDLADKVQAGLQIWKTIREQVTTAPESFDILLAPQLSPVQVTESLRALADYYRACGGAGLQSEIELVDVLVEAPSDVLA
jgi:hypothetical protein